MNRALQHPARGFLAALGAVAVLSIMDAIMKHLVLVLGLVAVSVWRAGANLALSSLLYLPRARTRPDGHTIFLHAYRSIIVTVMAALFFWGIARVPLAQAIALTFIAPLLAMLLAAWKLHEHVGRRTIIGALGAFLGVIIILFGQARAQAANDVLLGVAAIVGSALCYAVNIVLMRSQALAATPLEISFFQSLAVMLIWAGAVPFTGFPEWPGPQWFWVIFAALLSTSGTLLFAWGYARGPASYLAVTEYSGFLWASLMGWLVFSERVSLFTAVGAMMIVGGCFVAVRREQLPPEMDIAC